MLTSVICGVRSARSSRISPAPRRGPRAGRPPPVRRCESLFSPRHTGLRVPSEWLRYCRPCFKKKKVTDFRRSSLLPSKNVVILIYPRTRLHRTRPRRLAQPRRLARPRLHARVRALDLCGSAVRSADSGLRNPVFYYLGIPVFLTILIFLGYFCCLEEFCFLLSP